MIKESHEIGTNWESRAAIKSQSRIQHVGENPISTVINLLNIDRMSYIFICHDDMGLHVMYVCLKAQSKIIDLEIVTHGLFFVNCFITLELSITGKYNMS